MDGSVKEIIDLPIYSGSATLLSRETGLSKGTVEGGRLTVRTRRLLIEFLEVRIQLVEENLKKMKALIKKLKSL